MSGRFLASELVPSHSLGALGECRGTDRCTWRRPAPPFGQDPNGPRQLRSPASIRLAILCRFRGCSHHGHTGRGEAWLALRTSRVWDVPEDLLSVRVCQGVASFSRTALAACCVRVPCLSAALRNRSTLCRSAASVCFGKLPRSTVEL